MSVRYYCFCTDVDPGGGLGVKHASFMPQLLPLGVIQVSQGFPVSRADLGRSLAREGPHGRSLLNGTPNLELRGARSLPHPEVLGVGALDPAPRTA